MLRAFAYALDKLRGYIMRVFCGVTLGVALGLLVGGESPTIPAIVFALSFYALWGA